MIKNLPKFWFVENDNSDEFGNVVIKYINENYKHNWNLSKYKWIMWFKYYWYDWNKIVSWINCTDYVSTFINNPTFLTLSEFKKIINRKYI